MAFSETFHSFLWWSGKNNKKSKPIKQRSPFRFYQFMENKKICACHHIDLFLKNQKNIINSNCSSCLVLLNFMQQFTYQQYQNKLWKYLLALICKILTQKLSQLILRDQPLILPLAFQLYRAHVRWSW